MSHTITESIPKDFIEQVKFSALFIECQGKYLYLRMVGDENVNGKWGVLGGLVEEGEDVLVTAQRESLRRADIAIDLDQVKYLKPLYVMTSYTSFGFYVHTLSLKEFPEIRLSEEYDTHIWATKEEVEKLDHISGGEVPFKIVADHYMKNDYNVSETLTDDFEEQVKVAAVFVKCQGKYLYLRKAPGANLEGKWGVPGGKLEEGESLDKGAQRELLEEAGIEVCTHAIKYLKPIYVKTHYASFGFYIHALELKEMPEVVLSDEHDKFCWLPEEEVRNLDIMDGGMEPFDIALKHFDGKHRPQVTVSSYLILKDGDQVYLGERQNTGYMDGKLGLISGHVEEGESASTAMIREAEEEAGIKINPDDLKCSHIMHRKSDDSLRIDAFFECTKYEGAVVNQEPEKCGGWEKFDIHNLPETTMDYVKEAIKHSLAGNSYSEWGF